MAVTAAIAGPLLAASWWGHSDMGVTYRSLARECENVRSLGVRCDAAQTPRPRRPKIENECGVVVSVAHHDSPVPSVIES